MKKILFIIFILLGVFAKAQDHAVIIFAGEKNDYSKTYLGKVKKGSFQQLNNRLQNPRIQEDKTNSYAPKPNPNPKKRKKMRHLTDAYDVNEKALAKKNKRQYEKYQKEKEKYYKDQQKKKKKKEKKQFDSKAFAESLKTDKTKLGKEYKIKGKRLRKGKQLKYKTNNVSMILRYKIKENGSVKTYITSMNSRIVPGEKYYLKYYGNDSNRKYYLEKIPNAN